MTINPKYKKILLEVVSEKLYRLALELNELKGGPMDKQRKMLTKKQQLLESLQHEVSMQ